MRRLTCCVDPTIPLLADALKPFVRLYCVPGSELSRELLKQLRCHAVFVRAHTRVTAELLRGTSVRFVGTPGSGIDHIAVEELQELGVTVAHAPGCNANAVAEYVLIALLQWCSLFRRPLTAQRLGIIGFGNIGRLVAYYAHRLGVEVWVSDPPLVRQGFRFPEWVTVVNTARELCAACTALTLHVPLTHSGPDATWHMLGAEELALFPRGGLMVQTSRGGVVDEAAVEAFLQEKRPVLAVDVWEQEPSVNWVLAEHALLATPHIAGYTWQARLRCSRTLVQRFAEWAGLDIPETPFAEALELTPPLLPEPPWEDPEQLLNILQQRRKLDRDTLVLRSWRALPTERQRQNAFRAFRDSYPRRYETLSPPAGLSTPC